MRRLDPAQDGTESNACKLGRMLLCGAADILGRFLASPTHYSPRLAAKESGPS